MKQRGLSDVVTTVLIILLVVVSVVAIGAYVVNLVGSSGRTVEREGVCLASTITVDGCRWFKSTSTVPGQTNRTVVSIASSTDSTVTAVSQLNFLFTYADGSSETFTSTNVLPGIGKASVSHDIANMSKQPSTVAVGGRYTIAGGKTVSCPVSVPASCITEATSNPSFLASSPSALNIAGSIGSGSSTPTPGAGSTGSGGSGSGSSGGGTPPTVTFTCVDSDVAQANPLLAQGTVTITPSTGSLTVSTDSCDSPTTVREFSCASSTSSVATPNSTLCTTNTCSGGRCVPSTPLPVPVDFLLGLVAYWPFNDTVYTGATAEVKDALGISHGATAGSPTLVSGLKGNAVHFRGAISPTVGITNQRIHITAPSTTFNVNTFTLSAWIKTPDAGNNRKRIFSQQAPSTISRVTQYYGIGLNGNNLECYSQLDSGVLTTGVGQFNQLLNDNQWHHVACVRNTGNEFVWYIDGARVKTIPLTGSSLSGYLMGNAGIVIGRFIGNAVEDFNGTIEDIRVYNTALTNGQINQVYNFTRNAP